jgi:hypothetical protein
MKKLVITAAALLALTASVHAETYNIEGVTIHVGNGCRSSSCVSVYAPGYGSYHGGRPARLHKAHKDTAQVASVSGKDDSAGVPAATAPATPAAEPAAAPPPAAAAPPQAAPQPAASDATPVK